jgi:hypothetical protein
VNNLEEELTIARKCVILIKRWMKETYPQHLLIESRGNPGQIMVKEMWDALNEYDKVTGAPERLPEKKVDSP